MITEHRFAGEDPATRFPDRPAAGRLLARRLAAYRGREDVLVLALPRGGVPVAFEVARELGTPSDVLVVRKLGVPGFRELAMGAIAGGGVRVLNESVVREAGVTPEQIEQVASSERRELERRERLYRGNVPPLDLRRRTVVLVDDGLATGATMPAAVIAVRQLGAARVIARCRERRRCRVGSGHRRDFVVLADREHWWTESSLLLRPHSGRIRAYTGRRRRCSPTCAS